MTTDQIIPGAIAVTILILIIVGVMRGVTRRRGRNEDTFGAGGVATVAAGTRGVAKTDLAPSGVALVAGEQWTARSAGGMTIPSGATIRVVSQDGLTLIVDPEPAGRPAEG